MWWRLWLVFALSLAVPAEVLSDRARLLLERLEAMEVTRHWLPRPGMIDWRSGEPLGAAAQTGVKPHTHCSAFAAAAAERLEVYLLRPPEHSPVLLANAQQAWLNSEAGRQAGWWRCVDGHQAQALANLGHLVLASWTNPNPQRPGHIAVVRPSLWPAGDGPELMQAGRRNYVSADLDTCFRRPAEVQFHYHLLP